MGWCCGKACKAATCDTSSPHGHQFKLLLPMQLSANGLGNIMENVPSVWTPASHVGDLDEASDFWIQPGPAPARPCPSCCGHLDGILFFSLSLIFCNLSKINNKS